MQAPLLTLDLAFALGVIHALDPSHGKPAVLAYLVGKRQSAWHSITLAAASAASHSVSILAIALMTHWAAHMVSHDPAASEHLASWLALASGWIMVAIGAYLAIQAIRSRATPSDHCCASHAPKSDQPRRDSFGMTTLLGITTGLIPCPMALTAILSTMSHGDLTSGVTTTLAFALGIAICLAALGIGLSFASQRVGRAVSHRLHSLPWPLLRALVILAIGIFYVAQGMDPAHHAHDHGHAHHAHHTH